MQQTRDPSIPAIVAGVDLFSSIVRQVLQSALDAARRLPRADVHFLAMAQVNAGLGHRKQIECREVEAASLRLRRCISDFLTSRERGRWQHARIFLHARCGDAGEELLNLCTETRADLLVLGKAPLADANLIDEHVIEFVLRQSVCPALVIQPKDYDEPALVSYCRHCPSCEDTRRRTAGRQWFCAAHQDARVRSVAQLHAP